MMDSNSELVVKEKHINLHPFDWETCEFLIKLKSASLELAAAGRSYFQCWLVVAALQPSCHRPLPSLPTNYSDMNFPVPDF